MARLEIDLMSGVTERLECSTLRGAYLQAGEIVSKGFRAERKESAFVPAVFYPPFQIVRVKVWKDSNDGAGRVETAMLKSAEGRGN